MNLIYHHPPHIRSRESNVSVMGDMIIALIPLYFMAYYFYGPRSLFLGLLSVLVCTLSDILCTMLARRKVGVIDLSPVITGMLIPLLLPASVGISLIVSAGLFAILVVKQPFGGLGQNIFNPAAAGIAFVTVTWPAQVFAYPVPLEGLERLVTSPGYKIMSSGGVPTYDGLDLLLGNFPGPMGATNILVLLTCLLFLMVRKTNNGKMAGAFLGSCALYAFLFPRINGGRLESVYYELVSGALVFAAIFLISDPATSPKRESSKVVYAAIAGLVTMLFRRFGGFEESVFFVILIMNAFVFLIDMKSEEIHSQLRRSRREEKSQAL